MNLTIRMVLACAAMLSCCIFSRATAQDLEQQSKSVFNAMVNQNDFVVALNARQGVISGGGFSIRNKLVNSRLYNVQLPRVSAGCGGIDLFMGSFSFISSEQLVAALRAIPSAAVSYGFHLALKSMCPSCEEAISKLQSELNGWTKNSLGACQLTQAMFESTGMDKGIQSTFTQNNAAEGWAHDYLAAQRQGEGTTPMSETADRNPQEHKEIIPGNVIWRALKTADAGSWLVGVSGSDDLLEMIMSLTGTYIWCTEGKGGCPSNDQVVGPRGDTLPIMKLPTMSVKDFIYGSDGDGATHAIKRLSCQGEMDQCLSVTEVDVTNMKGLKKMIEEIMLGVNGSDGLIDAQFNGNRPLTTQENGLIAGGGLYIQLAIKMAFKSPSVAKSLVASYSDVMAADLAEKILSEDLNVAMASLASRTGNRTDDGRKLVQAAENKLFSQMREIQASADARAKFTQHFVDLQGILPETDRPAAPIGSVD